MTVPFISQDDLAQAIDESVHDQDLATIALDTACDTVRAYLDRYLNLVTDETVLVDGSGTASLALPGFPVSDVDDSVTADGTAVANTRYALDPESGILYLTEFGATWPRGRRNISVKYSHGYAPTEGEVSAQVKRVPSDIRFVALSLARRLYTNAGVADGSASAVRDAIGGTEEWTPFTVPDLLTEDECYRLDPHRVRKAG